MLRIGICDDERQICSQVEQMLADIAEETRQDWEIQVFSSGEKLSEYLREGKFLDVLFLDIELPTINGIEVGKMIRYELSNEATKIVYISGKESYAMELFAIRPVDFLIKPLERTKLAETMHRIRYLIERGTRIFEYKNGYNSYKLPIRDILFFESSGKKIGIVMEKEKRQFYGKLSDVESQLGGRGFLFVHKSYLVNYAHVIEYQYESVTMSNRLILPISQNRRKDVRSWILTNDIGGDEYDIR
jgi:DNA-binding LytR/AlgR family response regulator